MNSVMMPTMVGSWEDSHTTPYMRSTLGWFSLDSSSASRQKAVWCRSTLAVCAGMCNMIREGAT